ncbi:hypothetical protein ACRB68_37310 [Actinomadura sp. RB68]|uniref:Uncharacterized protein n=2 Tax=Actinomadura macrotermitis TaxID=2585200 RepID=A0A7K0BYE5_9ACTN|nr:hypothetical protein [Actinomadura macrotermitis]
MQPVSADIAGREGVTLYRDQGGYLRGEVFVGPAGYAYLGFRFRALRDHAEPGLEPVRRGQIIGWGGVLKAGYVAGPGKKD